MSILKITIILLVFFLSACSSRRKDDYKKKINYNIDLFIYKADYEKALKYIDSVTFSYKLDEDFKKHLLFKEAEIKYLYSGKNKEAYDIMKNIYKNKNFLPSDYDKLITYLTDISQKTDRQNYGYFLKEIFEYKKNKEVFYKYYNFLKSEKNYGKIKELLKKADFLENDEKIYFELDLNATMINDFEKNLENFNRALKKVKNSRIKDKILIEKLLYLEKNEKLDFKLALEWLKEIKNKEYSDFVKNKKIFYNKQLSLYEKKK